MLNYARGAIINVYRELYRHSVMTQSERADGSVTIRHLSRAELRQDGDEAAVGAGAANVILINQQLYKDQ